MTRTEHLDEDDGERDSQPRAVLAGGFGSGDRMGLFGLGHGGRRAERKATEGALVEWIAARHGVEVYVEPKTAVTGVSIVLVAHDGEFHRRLIESPEVAKTFAREQSIPIYDATIVGYPQRMRNYSRRQKIIAERAERDRLG